jgi:repressor LexA
MGDLDLDTSIVDFIKQYSHEHGYPPTRREVATGVGKSTMTVQDHICRLADKGVLDLDKGVSRSIRLLRYPYGETPIDRGIGRAEH